MAPRASRLRIDPGWSRVFEVYARIVDLAPGEREAAARRICGKDAKTLDALLELLPHLDVETRQLRSLFKDRPGELPVETGRVVGGRWRIGRLLGAGATGSVYDATELDTGRNGALKFVYGIHDDTVAAVRREVALLRWLRLPGVAQLIDDGVIERGVYCVMEKVDGTRFPGLVRDGAWPGIESATLGLLEAISRVHAAGIVHCDLKPANVLVNPKGEITIVDLGLSSEGRTRFAGHGSARYGGTPAYEAPEQRLGGRPSVGWDLYSIGVMLYEALSGRLPDDPPVRDFASLPAPPNVRRVIASLLSPRRADRPRSALAVLARLRPAARRVRRARWTAAELRERFAGPDLLLHLREDAAAEILRRTGGRARDVEHEIGAWIRSGLAHRDGDLVVVGRPALERLRTQSGEDAADRAFMKSLKRGSPQQVARAALRVAARRMGQGRPSTALAALFEGASAARVSGDPRLELDVMRAAALAAVRTSSSAEIDRALVLLQRASLGAAPVRDLETVLRAALHFSAGRARDALGELVPVCESSSDPHALRIAWSVRHGIAQMLGLDEERRAVEGIRAWLARSRVQGGAGILATAEGWLAYHEGRFEDALVAHLRASGSVPDAYARARTQLDAAIAAVECDPQRALAHADRARRIGRSLRSPPVEGSAVQIERSVLVRTGAMAAPCVEFVDACARIGLRNLCAAAALAESVLAWRADRMDVVRSLASVAAENWKGTTRYEIALSLAAAAGEPTEDAALERARRAAITTLPPAVGIQVLALVALARPSWRPELVADSAKLALSPTDQDEGRMREVLSIEAARRILSE